MLSFYVIEKHNVMDSTYAMKYCRPLFKRQQHVIMRLCEINHLFIKVSKQDFTIFLCIVVHTGNLAENILRSPSASVNSATGRFRNECFSFFFIS